MKQTDVFKSRLQSWAALRTRLRQDSISTALQSLNSWWFEIAWCLEQQALCDVARGLGIMYTIAMLDREDLGDFVLFEETEHNLVLVRSEKYILNYSSNDILNTSLEIGKTKKRRSQTLADIKTRIK